MKLKVCGMKYADNILEVSKLLPDFIGFIFYSESKRFVGEHFKLPYISSSIKKVGVFVNANMEYIIDKVKRYKLDYIQLHGNESAEFCKQVGEGVKIIKAFGIHEQFDFSVLNKFEDCCDYFLFDTKTNEFGGSGKSFDTNTLKNYKLTKPFFLSGGIDIGAGSDAILADTRLFAMDVNSKFEMEPGLKDVNKLKIFQNELSGKC